MRLNAREADEQMQLDLEVGEDSGVGTVFIGFETTDGSEYVLCRSEPPLSVSIHGKVPTEEV